MEKEKEGRVSPEQEAEEMENQYDEEPILKFGGILYESQKDIKEEGSPNKGSNENPTVAKLKLLFKTNGNQQSSLAPNSMPLETLRHSEEKGGLSLQIPGCTQVPLKIPRIILTRPSTSDEDADQLTHDQEEYELEEVDIAEDHLFLDCLNNGPDTT